MSRRTEAICSLLRVLPDRRDQRPPLRQVPVEPVLGGRPLHAEIMPRRLRGRSNPLCEINDRENDEDEHEDAATDVHGRPIPHGEPLNTSTADIQRVGSTSASLRGRRPRRSRGDLHRGVRRGPVVPLAVARRRDLCGVRGGNGSGLSPRRPSRRDTPSSLGTRRPPRSGHLLMSCWPVTPRWRWPPRFSNDSSAIGRARRSPRSVHRRAQHPMSPTLRACTSPCGRSRRAAGSWRRSCAAPFEPATQMDSARTSSRRTSGTCRSIGGSGSRSRPSWPSWKVRSRSGRCGGHRQLLIDDAYSVNIELTCDRLPHRSRQPDRLRQGASP